MVASTYCHELITSASFSRYRISSSLVIILQVPMVLTTNPCRQLMKDIQYTATETVSCHATNVASTIKPRNISNIFVSYNVFKISLLVHFCAQRCFPKNTV